MASPRDYDTIVLPSLGNPQTHTRDEQANAFKMATALRCSGNPLVKRFYWSVYNTNRANNMPADKNESPIHGKSYFGYTQKCLWNAGLRWIGERRDPKGDWAIKDLVSIELVEEEWRAKIKTYFDGDRQALDPNMQPPHPSTGLVHVDLSSDDDDDDDEVEVVLVIAAPVREPVARAPVAVPVAASRPAPRAEDAYLQWLANHQQDQEERFEQIMEFHHNELKRMREIAEWRMDGLVRTVRARIESNSNRWESDTDDTEDSEDSDDEFVNPFDDDDVIAHAFADV
jgi:hypothetical protein